MPIGDSVQLLFSATLYLVLFRFPDFSVCKFHFGDEKCQATHPFTDTLGSYRNSPTWNRYAQLAEEARDEASADDRRAYLQEKFAEGLAAPK
jgi:hypothetical protein